MYFQCDPGEDAATWSQDRIWAELQARVTGQDGFTLNQGPITEQMVLRFRSFVSEPMRYGNMLLAGDSAHTVPPTGAKGLNLALADVRILAEVLERAILNKDARSARRLRPACSRPRLARAALLLLDDHHASSPSGRRAVRHSADKSGN